MSNSTIELTHHRFNVKQYHEMYRSGILADCDRTELIYGELLTMSPINRRHAACVKQSRAFKQCKASFVVTPSTLSMPFAT